MGLPPLFILLHSLLNPWLLTQRLKWLPTCQPSYLYSSHMEKVSEKEVCLLCLTTSTSTSLASVILSDLPVTWILQNGPRGPGRITQNGGEGPGQDQRSPS